MKTSVPAIAGQIKKSVLTGLSVFAAGAAVLSALLLPVAKPETTAVPDSPPAIEMVIEQAPAADMETAADTDEQHKKQRRRTARQRLFSCIQAVLSFCLGAAAHLLSFLCKVLAAGLFGASASALLAFLGDVLVTFLVMLLLFSWLFHKLFPDKRLRDFWTVKNLLLMFVGALALNLVRLLLRRCDAIPDALLIFFESFLSCALYLGTFVLLYRTGIARGERAKRLTQRILLSKPALLALLCLLLLSVASACVQALLPGIGEMRAFLSFACLFLLCFASCALIYAVRSARVQIPVPAQDAFLH